MSFFGGGGGGGGANTALSNIAAVAASASINPGADNTLDLGATTFRWANVKIGTAIVAGTGAVDDAFITRAAAATWQLGAADAAAPVAQILQAQGSRAGTDANVGGGNLTIASGRGTGTGAASTIIFQTPATVGAGSGAQTMATRLTISATRIMTQTSDIIVSTDGTTIGFDFNNSTVNTSMVQIKRLGVFGNLGAIGIGSGGGLAWASTIGFSNVNADLFLSRGGAATLQLGAANAAAPVNQILQAQGARAGTDNNTAGASLTVQPGNGTGNATGSAYIVATPTAVASGTGAQTQTERHRTDQFGLKMSAARFQWDQGADVVAANDLTLGEDGNYFVITGNTQVNAITTAGWQAGTEVLLRFTGTPTVKNNTAGGAGTATLLLTGGADLVVAAITFLRLIYDGTNWRQSAPVITNAA